ncbi:MAG: PEP-CTERM sorting domain-containing protein [Deltaproteobacteria bacterium]|nr:PEP-CTERM sorting domain-containing protein [Deltaproteobacteria bacterium]
MSLASIFNCRTSAQVVSFHIAMGGVFDDQLSVNVFGKVAPVPEPATMFLFGAGLIGLGALGRKKMLK